LRWNNWNGENGFLISQRELSDLWEELHGGAFRVYLKALKSDKMLEMKVAYAVKDERIMLIKHEFKEYPESSKVGYLGNTTRGWLSKNCDIVKKY
jgi:hypothetical protein